jgi:hypothetical protein
MIMYSTAELKLQALTLTANAGGFTLTVCLIHKQQLPTPINCSKQYYIDQKFWKH